MTKYEKFTLEYYLCNYPKDLDFDEILNLIEEESLLITIWHPFLDFSGADVAEFMLNMTQLLKDTFGGK